MAFEEIKLNYPDMVARAMNYLGYVYNPSAKRGVPNVFDPKTKKPVCIFKQAIFNPDGYVCLFIDFLDGREGYHLHSYISLDKNEEDLLTGCPYDIEDLH